MKKTTRLLLAVLLVAVLCLSLTACKAHEHTYGDWTLTTAPTLTTEGTATHKCTDCNETESVTVPALTDTSVWTATPNPAPTHTTAGKTDYTSIYGKVTVDVDALGDAHVFDQKNTDAKYLKSEATCTSAAVYYYSCVCGEKGTETFTDGEPLAHSYAFSDWATKPTLTEGGVANMECSVCHGTTTANVAALSDSTVWSKVDNKHVDATCSAAGKDVYANATYGEVEVAIATTAHTYTFVSWATEPTLTEDGVANLKCANCTATKTETVAKLSDTSVWTAVNTAATYEDDAYTTYTATIGGVEKSFSIVESGSRLIALFENKMYKGGMLFASHDSFASKDAFVSIGAKGVADDTFYKKNTTSSEDDEGDDSGYGTGTYSNQKIKFSVVDATKGIITVTFTWTESGSDDKENNYTEVYNGYMSADGKYIVYDRYKIGDTSEGFNGFYVFIQVESADDEVLFNTINPYDTNVGKVVGLTVNGTENIVFKYNKTFYFGVTLSDLTGEALTVAQSENVSNVVVKDATGARIAGFVLVEYQDDEGRTRTRFAETDGLDGVYTNGSEKATLDGNGKLTVESQDVTLEGTYTRAAAGSDHTLDVFVEGAGIKAYYQVTLGENYTYTKIAPQGTINYVLNEGTLGDHKTSVNIGIAYTLPVPTREGYHFAGWYTTANPESVEEACTEITIALGNSEVTVYAVWTQSVKVVFNGLLEGATLETTIEVGEAFLSKAPADYIVGLKLNADGTQGFKGWFYSDSFDTEASESDIADLLSYSGETINLYAKWENLAVVTLKYGHLLEDKEIRLGKGAPFAKALSAEYNVKYNNGRPFEAWYVDVDKDGVIGQGDYAVDEGTIVADGMVFIAKWNENVSWKIDNSANYTFVYDATDGQWKSNNKGVSSSDALLKIIPIGGEIEVSFKIWASSESATKYDYATVWYFSDAQTTRYTSDKFGGSSATEKDAKEYKLTLYPNSTTSDPPLKFQYQKDGSGQGGSDTAYIIDLTINGVKITSANSTDYLDGYYTKEGGERLALDGFGGLTLGTESGTYTLASAGAGYTALAMVGGKTYKLTLSGNNYNLVEYNATVSFEFGDVDASLASVTAPFGTTYTLPEAPVVSGYVFRGWYTEAAFTNKVETVVLSSDEVTLYAKYDVAVTVTYNYLDGTTENFVENLYANDKAAKAPAVEFKYGTKVFAGWFTADGTDSGDWGSQFTNGTTVTGSINVYAKWVEPHALAGTYKGGNFYSDQGKIEYKTNSSLSSALTIDNFGNVSGYQSGKIEDYNAETGTFALVSGSSRYNGYADIANGVLEIDYNSGKTTNERDIYLFFATNGDVSASSAESVAWTKATIKIVTVKFSDDSTKNLFVYNRVVYTGATWVATDSNGAAVTTLSKIASEATVITVTVGTNNYAFAKNSSGDVVAQDGTQGTFTCEGAQNLVLNGAGLASGALNGTYKAAADGADYTYDVTTSEGQYKVTVSGSTYTVADNRVTISFENELKEIGAMTPFYGKSATLPSGDAVAVEGYKFRGWYENADFSGGAKTTVTLTENKTYYAKYDAIVTITFDYSGYEYEEGTTTKVVNTLAIGDTLGNTIPAIASDVRYEGKVFVGWFTKNGEEWGEQAASSTTIAAAVTYYAKWVEPAAATGEYKGFEIYFTHGQKEKTTSSFESILTITETGKYSGKTNGTLSSEDFGKTEGAINIGRRGYVVTSANLIVIRYNGVDVDTWGNDTYIGFRDYSTINKVKFSSTAIGGKLVAFISVEYKDGTTKNVFIANDIVVADVTFAEGGVAVNGYDCTTKNGVLISKNGSALYLWKDKALMGSDGLTGTYTGEYGDIVLDGYGTLTIGGATTAYTVDGSNITFVAANAMRIVALGEGTYTAVADAYAGEYTLPDGSKITLDGFGGAGDGKTYVVSGANITIYDGETSTAYGLDVANKALLGKTIFAGLTFVGTGYELVFDDSSLISGKFASKGYPIYEYGFEGTLVGNVLTITIKTEKYSMGFVDKTITATVENGKITFTSEFKYDNVTNINGTTATCDTFVFA